MIALHIPDADERGDLGAFVARVVRLDPAATTRLRGGPGTVTAWASTPFDVLATRGVHGRIDPSDAVLPARSLLAALAVERSATMALDPAGVWIADLPPDSGWTTVDVVPAAEIEALTERGLTLARDHAGPLGPPASLLDQTVLTVSRAGDGDRVTTVKVPLRCLFALSGMGFLAGADDPPVRVSATGSWLRLDARFGAVVRRRMLTLPLLV